MYIKTNNEVKNQEDVKNLIASIIFRQTKSFTTGQIQKTVNFYLRNSEFYCKYKTIKKLVDYALDVCQRNDVVVCCAGRYYPRQIDGSFIPEYYEASKKAHCY